VAESEWRVGRPARPSARHGPIPPDPARRHRPHPAPLSACRAGVCSVVDTGVGPRRRVRSRRPRARDQAPGPRLDAPTARPGCSALRRAPRSDTPLVALRRHRRPRRRAGRDLDDHPSFGLRWNRATPHGRAVSTDHPRRPTPRRCRSRLGDRRSGGLGRRQGSRRRPRDERGVEHSRLGIAPGAAPVRDQPPDAGRGGHVAGRPEPDQRQRRHRSRHGSWCRGATAPERRRGVVEFLVVVRAVSAPPLRMGPATRRRPEANRQTGRWHRQRCVPRRARRGGASISPRAGR